MIQKSRSRELTLDLILQLTASFLGFMYFIGGIKPGANSLHVWSVVHGSENGTSGTILCYTRLLTPPPCIDESLWGARSGGMCVDGPAFLCHGAAVKLLKPARQKNWENRKGDGPVGKE